MIFPIMTGQTVTHLKRLAAAIGEDPKTLPGWEEFGQVMFEKEYLPASIALKIELDHLTPLVNAFDQACICQFSLHQNDLSSPNQNPLLLDVKRDIKQSDIDNFRNQIRDLENIYFYFRLDKHRLLKDNNISAENCSFYLYFFPESLTLFLKGESTVGEVCNVHASFKELEDNLWPQGIARKAVILALGHDIWLNGPYFGLIGGRYLDRWQETIPQEPPDFGRLDTIYDNCRAAVAWDDRWITHLTPPRLKVKGEWDVGDPMVDALRTHLLNLIVLFTANRTAGGDDDWSVTYSDSDYTQAMLLLSPAQKQIDSQNLDNIDHFYEVFKWAYDSEWPRDRIPFVQSVVAQELMRKVATEAYQVLLIRARVIRENLDRRWSQFVHQKLREYAAEERQLEEFVAKTADAFSEQVSAMIKAVSDTMLAAIATLLGSFIAAGFGGDEFNAGIFTVGMVAYSLYVLAFPLLYSMGNQWTRYKALEESMNANLDRFNEQLGTDEVKKLVGARLDKSKQRFIYWFWATVAVYAVAVIIGLEIAFLVPRIVP